MITVLILVSKLHNLIPFLENHPLLELPELLIVILPLWQVEVDFVERHAVFVLSDWKKFGILFIFSVDISIDIILSGEYFLFLDLLCI